MKKYLLPKDGTFYKANLHCHSTVSDGGWSPERIKEEYMARGYSVIAYTDHDVLIPHPELTDAHFLALNGYEMEVDEIREDGRQGKCCHMCLVALEPDNVEQVCWHRSKYLFGNSRGYRDQVRYHDEPDYERTYTHECISDMMRLGRENGFFVTYNHPVWSREDWRDYSGYEGMHAMEICNWGCVVEGHDDYVPHVYDDILRLGRRIYCIGTDDNHNGSLADSFGAFTVIKAPCLEYRAITQALLDGHFYASQGPEIHELWVEDGRIHIRCSDARKIECNFDIQKAYCAWSDGAEPLREASFPLSEKAAYVRLTVTDFEGNHANTNAYWLDEL